jgi:hypothetical protein
MEILDNNRFLMIGARFSAASGYVFALGNVSLPVRPLGPPAAHRDLARPIAR